MSKRCMRCNKETNNLELIQICDSCWKDDGICVDGGDHYCTYCMDFFDNSDNLKHQCASCRYRSKGNRYCTEEEEEE